MEPGEAFAWASRRLACFPADFPPSQPRQHSFFLTQPDPARILRLTWVPHIRGLHVLVVIHVNVVFLHKILAVSVVARVFRRASCEYLSETTRVMACRV